MNGPPVRRRPIAIAVVFVLAGCAAAPSVVSPSVSPSATDSSHPSAAVSPSSATPTATRTPGPSPSATSSAGPAITITDPLPGNTTVVSGSRYRVGWREQAAQGKPILQRRVERYQASAPDGRCSSATYLPDRPDSRSNRPFSYPATGLTIGMCYFWVVEVTDLDGRSARAQSGFLRRTVGGGSGGLESQGPRPELDVRFPTAGATSEAPPGVRLTIAWNEAGPIPVTNRTVVEEFTALQADRVCDTGGWTFSRRLAPSEASVALAAPRDGTCYRYRIFVTDAEGGRATALSGPLLATRAPPSCAYGDILTVHRLDSDWARVLVDDTYRLPFRYAPADLVTAAGIAGIDPAFRIRRVALAGLRGLADAARAAGVPIQLDSAYRSRAQQIRTFDLYVRQLGLAGALLRAARPGHSEHQLGTAIDVRAQGGRSPASYADWAKTETGAWLAANAWRYGWVMGYPKGASQVSCYQYEPWHYRYVGRPTARAVHHSGLTLRQYLWLNGSLVSRE